MPGHPGVASFISPSDIRGLRELCRYRLKLTCMRTSEKNRYQNSMTVSKVRLDSVFSDPFGKSAGSIMSYLIHTDPDRVRDGEILRLVDPRVKASAEEILDSIHGYEFIGVQRDKLEVIQTHMDNINAYIGMIDAKLLYYRQKYVRKYQTLKKRRGHKKAVIAIARKMLVAIYHMIRDNADFLPVDYDDAIARNNKNVIAFLGAHGADAETIRMVEAQCTENKTEVEMGTGAEDKSRKNKQPQSDTEPSNLPGQKTVRRKRSKKSPQTKDHDSSKQPASATATA